MKYANIALPLVFLIIFLGYIAYVLRFHWERKPKSERIGPKAKSVSTISIQTNTSPKQLEFCTACGAGVGAFRRDGEGTCPKCDPQTLLKNYGHTPTEYGPTCIAHAKKVCVDCEVDFQ